MSDPRHVVAPPPQEQQVIQPQADVQIQDQTQADLMDTNSFAQFDDLHTIARPKPITATRQDGCNCGCFASGIALASLMRPTFIAKAANYSEPYREHQNLLEDFAKHMSKDLQALAKIRHLSADGEMFNAQALTDTINHYLHFSVSNEPLGFQTPLQKFLEKKGPHFQAFTLSFDTQERLWTILQAAQDKGARVLFPYFAGWNLMPSSKADTAPPQQMERAHWCNLQLPSSSDVVEMTESNMVQVHTPFQVQNLFASNQYLGDKFDWTSFCERYSKGAQYHSLVQNRLQHVPEAFANVAMEDKLHIMEHVDLRGKLILIGRLEHPLPSAQDSQDP